MKPHISVIAIATVIVASIGTSDTGVGHLVTNFPGLAGTSVGLLIAGTRMLFVQV